MALMARSVSVLVLRAATGSSSSSRSSIGWYRSGEPGRARGGVARLHFWQVFSKEATEKRRRELSEEMQRGYFDDMKDLRETEGRVGAAPEEITPRENAVPFPAIDECVDTEGRAVPLPTPGVVSHSDGEGSSATGAMLLALAFRDGAQAHIDSWKMGVAREFAGVDDSRLRIVELGLIDSWVMGLTPFRMSILANAKRAAAATATTSDANVQCLTTMQAFRFGNAETLRVSMNLHNKLTGFVFLLDSDGRVRWRMSGPARPGEDEVLIRCVANLLREEEQLQQQYQHLRVRQHKTPTSSKRKAVR